MLMTLGFVMPGGSEWILIVIVVVLLFGASKLPELARSAGSALGEFKKARYAAEKEVNEVKRETVEGEPETVKKEEAPEAAAE